MDYAWRQPGRDPYRVLVSEVMLQQTQAARVGPAFETFVERFPDLAALAAASRADVIRAWDGLGYNRRAVALHEAARAVGVAGRLPADVGALRALPGVGPYTAAAVASIAFGLPVAAVDTNVRRVMARLELGTTSAEPAAVAAAADGWLDRDDPGAWNQAVMNLGRALCRPSPRCEDCPLARWCRWRAAGADDRGPRRRSPEFEGSARQVRGAVVRVLRRRAGATVPELAAETGHEPERVRQAADALVAEGLLERSRGRLQLASG